jgi:hypothetical protein
MQDEHSLDRQGQPSSGQPPAAESPVSDPLASGAASKKARRLLLWWLLFVVASLSWVAYAVSWVSTVVHDPASTVVNQYYAAIKNQDYATAFRFVGGAKALNGEYYTQTTFTQEGQQIDTAEGKVRDYSILSSIYSQREAGTGKFPSNRYTYTVETANVTVSVTRNGAAYSIDLQLQQQGEEWKIINLDGL